jgi:hypothetical protein
LSVAIAMMAKHQLAAAALSRHLLMAKCKAALLDVVGAEAPDSARSEGNSGAGPESRIPR